MMSLSSATTSRAASVEHDEESSHETMHEDEEQEPGYAKVYPGRLTGWRRVVHGFTPNWFSVNMGTGIVSQLLFAIPWQSTWLYWLAILVFLLNILLFCIFLILTTLRYTLYPRLLVPMLKDLDQSLFIGTMSMGFSTIIVMLVEIGVPVLGQPALTASWALWWINVVIAVSTCYSMPLLVMYAHKKELRYISGTWVLPVVTTIVVSAAGSIVAGSLTNPQHALWTLVACYILWGSGLFLAMFVLVIYLLRMTLHRFPPNDNTVSVLLPLGPLGQGAFAVQRFGAIARDLFPVTDTLENASTGAGNILYVLGWASALPLWGFAMIWLTVGCIHIFSRRFPFNMGWWAFTFPLGTVALATIQLGTDTPSLFFDVLGTIFAVMVILLWILCFLKTAQKTWTRDLFPVP